MRGQTEYSNWIPKKIIAIGAVLSVLFAGVAVAPLIIGGLLRILGIVLAATAAFFLRFAVYMAVSRRCS